ncbi:hypothetical protein D0Y65_028875, partial [Glycine soja]
FVELRRDVCNCNLHSPYHRSLSIRQITFFLDPHPDCVVECLESCRSESSGLQGKNKFVLLFWIHITKFMLVYTEIHITQKDNLLLSPV